MRRGKRNKKEKVEKEEEASLSFFSLQQGRIREEIELLLFQYSFSNFPYLVEQRAKKERRRKGRFEEEKDNEDKKIQKIKVEKRRGGR